MKRIVFIALLGSLAGQAQTWERVDSIDVADLVWDKPRVDVSSNDDIFLSFETKNSGRPLILSSDGGQSWSTVKANYQYGFIGFDSQDRMYIVSSKKRANVSTTRFDSLYYSTDMGTTLQAIDEVPDNGWRVENFYIDPSDNFYTSGSGTGPDYAREFAIYNAGAPSGTMYGPFDVFSSGQRSMIILSNGNIVFSSYNSGIRYSTDGGSTWIESQGDGDLGNVTFVNFAEAFNGDLFLGGAGLVQCSDGGETWTDASLNKNFIADVKVGANGTLYAMPQYDNLHYSTDNGATWQEVTTTPAGTYSDMAVSDNYVYIIKNNVLYRTEVLGSGIGIDEHALGALHIYPNPSSGSVTIELPDHAGTMNVMIVDARGSEVANLKCAFSDRMTISGDVFRSNGIYTLVLFDENGAFVQSGQVLVQ